MEPGYYKNGTKKKRGENGMSEKLDKLKLIEWLSEEEAKSKRLMEKYKKKTKSFLGLFDINGTNLRNWNYFLDRWCFFSEIKIEINSGSFDLKKEAKAGK